MSPEPSTPVRVLVVDDSVVMRRMITEALATDGIEVVGVAANGKIALQKMAQVNPDIVTCDIEMPDMDGVTAVRAMRAQGFKAPVIMCSSLTMAGASATLDALAAGANDWVTKPAQSADIADGIAKLAAELVPKIRALVPTRRGAAAPNVRDVPSVSPAARSTIRRPSRAPEILCIGSSTGGPNALADVFGALTEVLPVPVVIVQHMPPLFTKSLAERLGRRSVHRFFEAEEGQAIEAGAVYIAPGGRHMEIERGLRQTVARLHDGPPENSCRPAADVLFRSVAKAYGASTLACVLTGMGQDGMRGSEQVRAAGGTVLAQDQETSVVWGMPGAVVQAGLADGVHPLPMMASALRDRLLVAAARR
jgi:two-component system chemotaxis response regulator CheB